MNYDDLLQAVLHRGKDVVEQRRQLAGARQERVVKGDALIEMLMLAEFKPNTPGPDYEPRSADRHDHQVPIFTGYLARLEVALRSSNLFPAQRTSPRSVVTANVGRRTGERNRMRLARFQYRSGWQRFDMPMISNMQI